MLFCPLTRFCSRCTRATRQALPKKKWKLEELWMLWSTLRVLTLLTLNSKPPSLWLTSWSIILLKASMKKSILTTLLTNLKFHASLLLAPSSISKSLLSGIWCPTRLKTTSWKWVPAILCKPWLWCKTKEGCLKVHFTHVWTRLRRNWMDLSHLNFPSLSLFWPVIFVKLIQANTPPLPRFKMLWILIVTKLVLKTSPRSATVPMWLKALRICSHTFLITSLASSVKSPTL